MGTWNDGYNAQPTGSDTVSVTPAQFQDLKGKIWARIKYEHDRDTTGSDGWRHLEGSARVYVGESAPSKMPDGDTDFRASDWKGRAWLDTSGDAVVLKVHNGSTWVEADNVNGDFNVTGKLTVNELEVTTSDFVTFTESGGVVTLEHDTSSTANIAWSVDEDGPLLTPPVDGSTGGLGTDERKWKHIYGDSVYGLKASDVSDRLSVREIGEPIPHGAAVIIDKNGVVWRSRTLADTRAVGVHVDHESGLTVGQSTRNQISVVIAGVIAVPVSGKVAAGDALCVGRSGFLVRAPLWVRVFRPGTVLGYVVGAPWTTTWNDRSTAGCTMVRI